MPARRVVPATHCVSRDLSTCAGLILLLRAFHGQINQLQTNIPSALFWPDWLTPTSPECKRTNAFIVSGKTVNTVWRICHRTSNEFRKLSWKCTVEVMGSEAGLEWGRVHNHKAKGDGGSGCKLALSGILVAWRTSLRSPCVTADSQRYCIIRTLQLQIKKENKTKLEKIHIIQELEVVLHVFHDYRFRVFI